MRNRLWILGALAIAVLWPGCRPNDPERTAGRPVVLIVVDTLRADHLGIYGYPRDTSTGLDAWAGSGRVFDRAHATSPWTAPSFGSLFTGELPSRHGVLRQERPDGEELFGQLDSSVRTLAESLSGEGYATAAFVNNPFLSPEFGLDRGFDLYDYAAGNNADTRRAGEMIDLALGWIDERKDQSFFLVLQLFDPHMSYDAPAPYAGRYTDGIDSRLSLPVEELNEIRSGDLPLDESDRQFVAAAYDEEIAYVDAELTRLRDALTERGILGRGLVVITSDHGEEFFEHGGFEHGHAMWQELLHVPLIIWGPAIEAGRDRASVSIVDVASTILDFAGAPVPADLAGRSLWPRLQRAEPVRSRTIFAEHNLYGTELKVALRWPDKLIVNPSSGDKWLFDLDANPGEQLLPWSDRMSIADSLLAELTRRVESDLHRRTEQPPADLGEETVEKLRALGYVD